VPVDDHRIRSKVFDDVHALNHILSTNLESRRFSEYCVRRNAYIMAAIHGNGFCTSATLAVKTIVTNVLRVAAMDTVGDALVFLGKLSVMAGAGVIAMLMSTLTYYTDPVKYPNTFMSSPLLPVILSLIVGYIVASVFFNVRSMSSSFQYGDNVACLYI
jgi:hypothetical protein